MCALGPEDIGNVMEDGFAAVSSETNLSGRNAMKLSTMSLQELRALHEQVRRELKRQEKSEIAQARKQIVEISKRVGISLAEIIDSAIPAAAPLSTPRAQYHHPTDQSLRWTGRGRRPRWINEWIDKGKTLDTLRT